MTGKYDESPDLKGAIIATSEGKDGRTYTVKVDTKQAAERRSRVLSNDTVIAKSTGRLL